MLKTPACNTGAKCLDKVAEDAAIPGASDLFKPLFHYLTRAGPSLFAALDVSIQDVVGRPNEL